MSVAVTHESKNVTSMSRSTTRHTLTNLVYQSSVGLNFWYAVLQDTWEYVTFFGHSNIDLKP